MEQGLNSLQRARVAVIGDLILDRYWQGSTRRISPEAPVPVVHVEDTFERVGGAANVAANIAALGGHASLLGLVGDDAEADTLVMLCQQAGITTDFIRVAGARTTVKLRVVSQRQQLVRLDFESVFDAAPAGELGHAFEQRVAQCDLIVVSDYAKGALARVTDIINYARARSKPVIVDPKSNDFSRYAGATVITPNQKEFEDVVGRCATTEALVARARELLERHRFGAILITRGAAGMSLVQADGEVTHVAPAAQEVFDVTGAGDTVCGVLAAALATGHRLPAAVRIANAAASLVVGKFGAATVSCDEIEAALTARERGFHGVMTPAGLIAACTSARQRGERLIMTNGCFDVLHAGHARYLEQARRLGDRLIVAVNDDESVRRLKGETRPVNNLQARMQMLAALAAVDWVVPFSADTPLQIISDVVPDVLVKGGDYAISDIVGADVVRAAGGEVIALDYHEGYSSSAVIARIEQSAESAS